MVVQQLCHPPHTCVQHKPYACVVLTKCFPLHSVGISQQCLAANCYFGPELDLQEFSGGCGLVACPPFPFIVMGGPSTQQGLHGQLRSPSVVPIESQNHFSWERPQDN